MANMRSKRAVCRLKQVQGKRLQFLFGVSPLSPSSIRLYIHPSLSHPLLHTPLIDDLAVVVAPPVLRWPVTLGKLRTPLIKLLFPSSSSSPLHPSSLFLHRIPASSRSNERAELARKIKLPAIVSYRFFPLPTLHFFSAVWCIGVARCFVNNDPGIMRR